jgi:hypothetical protein
VNGYGHPAYAEALAEFGRPLCLPRSGGHLLIRSIGARPERDAMGPYPLFACQTWSGLSADLDELDGELVSVALVADPFGPWAEADLRRCFGDVVLPFKEHFIVVFGPPLAEIVSRHHRYYANWALKRVAVSRAEQPAAFADGWVSLYANVIRRHRLTGIHAFSPKALAAMLAVPGAELFQAWHGETVVAAHLWYVQGEVAYSHLIAAAPEAYPLCAQYALYWTALDHFADRVKALDLGGSAGGGRGADTLGRFKRGWANDSRMANFCGRIVNPDRYRRLTRDAGADGSAYFPAYRRGEFG